MFMQDLIEEASYQIGTRRAHFVFGKSKDRFDSYVSKQPDRVKRKYSITTRQLNIPYSQPNSIYFSLNYCAYLFPIVCVDVSASLPIFISIYLPLLFASRSKFSTVRCDSLRVFVTVKSLYEGTLVTCWTTAPGLPPQRSLAPQLASLATLLFVLVSLTIAARCYAQPLVQLQKHPHPTNLSPITNSKIHSSTIVLSRILLSQPVQSDTSLIFKKSRNRNAESRTKREIDAQTFDRIAKYVTQKQTFKQILSNSLDSAESKRNWRGRNFSNLRKRSDRLGVRKIKDPSEGVSDSRARVNTTEIDERHQNDSGFEADNPEEEAPPTTTLRPMPPVHGHDSFSSVSEWGWVLVLLVSAVVLTVALGLFTCVLSHHRSGAVPGGGGTDADPNHAAPTPTSAPMLSVVSAGAAAGVGGMDRLRGGRAARELAATRDRQVRLHAMHTDIAINLPPSISMPDGEDHPYNSRLHLRDAEQESEIYQKCIRPPPNRTVLESESPPPYRSSSAGLLGSTSSSSSSSSGDWSGGSAPLVVRCHSMSSTSAKRPEHHHHHHTTVAGAASTSQKTDFIQRTVKIFTGKKNQQPPPPPAPTLPVVIVPTKPRRPSDQQNINRPKPGV